MLTTVRARLRSEVPHLRRYARILTECPAEADRLVRQCIKMALACHARRNPNEDIRIWLFQILHNLAAGNARRRRRSDHAEPSIGDVFAERGVFQYLEAAVHALKRLPIEYREAAFLVVVERLTYEEAATVLGLSSRTVQSRLSEARKALRSALFPGRSRDTD